MTKINFSVDSCFGFDNPPRFSGGKSDIYEEETRGCVSQRGCLNFLVVRVGVLIPFLPAGGGWACVVVGGWWYEGLGARLFPIKACSVKGLVGAVSGAIVVWRHVRRVVWRARWVTARVFTGRSDGCRFQPDTGGGELAYGLFRAGSWGEAGGPS